MNLRFRFKMSGLHVVGSATALTMVLGGLYIGWYHWPGWYLADVKSAAGVLIVVDLVLGPLLTLLIASDKKSGRTLARDIAVIIAVQLLALGYGGLQLWNGRPLYYAYSEGYLQLVQAYDISPEQAALGREMVPELAPHWYMTPRWIWAPLPSNHDDQTKIMAAAITGGDDVISMPRYFKPWQQGLTELASRLKKLDDLGNFTTAQKKTLKDAMHAAGYDSNTANAMPLTGRGKPLLAVFDAKERRVAAILDAP
jgi:hypothetical protein